MGNYVSIGITALVCVAALIGLFVGLGRRTVKSALRLASYAVAALISMFVSKPISNVIYDSAIKDALESVANGGGVANPILTAEGLVGEVIRGLASGVTAMVVFGVLFCVLSILMIIPYQIIARKIVTKENRRTFPCDRLCGMLLGIITGVFFMGVWMGPVMSIADIATEAVPSIMATDEESAEENRDVIDICQSVSDNWFVNISGRMGDVFNTQLTRISVGGNSMCITTELKGIVPIADEIMPAISGDEPDYAAALEAVADYIKESEGISAIVCAFVVDLTEAWAEGEAYMGIAPPQMEGVMGDIIGEVCDVFSHSTVDTIKEDLVTVAGIIEVATEYGMLDSIGGEGGEEFDILEAITQEGFIEDLLTKVTSNDRMKELLPTLINTGIQSMGSSLGLPADKNEVYDNFITAITAELNASTLTSDKLSEILKKNGVEIDESIVPAITTALVKGFEDFVPNVEESEIQEFFAIAFDFSDMDEVDSKDGGSIDKASVYLQAAKDLCQELKETFETAPTIDVAAVEALKSVDTFVTKAVTLDTIKVSKDALLSLSQEELEKEVKALSNVVASVTQFVDSMNKGDEEISIEDLDIKALGSAMDSLFDSALLGDVAKDTIDAVISSPSIGDSLPIDTDKIDIDSIINNEDVKFEELFEVTQKATQIVMDITNNGGQDIEKLEENVSWLLHNMTKGVADVVKTLFAPDLLTAAGIPEDFAEGICFTLGALCDNMAESHELSEEEVKKEADAVFSLFDMAINAEEGLDLADYIDAIVTSKVIMNTISDVVTEKGFDPLNLGETLGAKNVEEMVKTYVEMHSAASDGASFKTNVIILAKFCGADVSAKIDGWMK